jgi:hypothetical protein
MAGSAFTGGCLCGRVRYAIAGPPRLVSHCHCSLCRRSAGAPFVTWLTVRQDAFRLVAGEPRQFRSSDHGWRAFCADCGTQVTSGSARYPKYVEVTAGSLDDPAAAVPERHVYWPDRLPWTADEDGLPRHVEGANSARVPGTEGGR